MLRLTGALIVILASFAIGRFMCDNVRRRALAINHLADFVEYISVSITTYKTPLEEIYSSITDNYLVDCGFVSLLDSGIYNAAITSGLLAGDEEREIMNKFSEKIGRGSVDDMEKLCSFTVTRLRNLEEQLRGEMPSKQKVYKTISILAGASAIIILI